MEIICPKCGEVSADELSYFYFEVFTAPLMKINPDGTVIVNWDDGAHVEAPQYPGSFFHHSPCGTEWKIKE